MSSVEKPKKKQAEKEQIEIHLSDIVDFLSVNRSLLILSAILGLLVGTVYAFSKPNTYTAQVSVLPEAQNKSNGSLGGLSSLAGLAGISLDNLNTQETIRPDLYPNILQSIPFVIHILDQEVYSSKSKKEIKLKKFLTTTENNFIENLFESPQSSLSILKDNGIRSNQNYLSETREIVQITKEQEDLITSVQRAVSSEFDRKTGIFSITVVETDPIIATLMARLSLEYLTTYLTNYRTEKSRQQFKFLSKQVDDAKSRYQTAEYAISKYRDQNRSLFLNTAKIEEQRLQAEYLLTQSVYNELSKQMEQAKIRIQEETPVFKVLEPATVPLHKSGPKRLTIIIISGLLTVFTVLIGLVIMRIKKYFTF